MLSHLLHLRGIESVVLESRSPGYVESRIRAGVLEQGTADLRDETAVAARMGYAGAADPVSRNGAATELGCDFVSAARDSGRGGRHRPMN
jgi:hypothetical protein